MGAGEATAVTPRARDTTAGAAVSTAAAAAEAGARGAAAAEVRGNRAAPSPGEVSLQLSHNIYEVYFTFLPAFFLVQSSCDLSRQERKVMVPFTFSVLSLCGAYINLLSAKRPCRTAKLETSEHLKDMNELFSKEQQ